ncbi:hypothetical protein [Streptomyces sp. NPDC050848]|uniref:hypothetical protein n=1 Tax=Streptomyces sp. NPDC050848 TaxID=3155791 RepID=UPI0033C5EC07
MNLTYARKMVTAGRALEVLRPDGIDTGDFYRAAWVQAISALEHWVQEEVLRRVAEQADKDSPQMPGKLREFRLLHRRNQIAHDADLVDGDHTARRDIDAAQVTDAVDWIERIALALAYALDEQAPTSAVVLPHPRETGPSPT